MLSKNDLIFLGAAIIYCGKTAKYGSFGDSFMVNDAANIATELYKKIFNEDEDKMIFKNNDE